METTHCIILCGGENSRWQGYQNSKRKHLVKIEGEVLLNRTLRLVKTYVPTKTFVVINKEDLTLYQSIVNSEVEFYCINSVTKNHTEAYKYLSSKDLWNPNGRTIVLLGDVWYSEEAMIKIFADFSNEWYAFGRPGKSEITGSAYGELFAQKFRCFNEHEKNLIKLDKMYRLGTCTRRASGWAHYQLMFGADPNNHEYNSKFIEINDFTEDFDTPQDYDNWVKNRSLYYKKKTPKTITKPFSIESPKTQRNALCSCGSGRKYKKCCMQ